MIGLQISARLDRRCYLVFAVAWVLGLTNGAALADDVTAGPNGINARGLGLSGAGVNIGQVELGRPGERLNLPNFDTTGEWFWDFGADRIPGTADAGEGNGVRDFPEWFVDLDGDNAYTPGWVNAHPDVEPWDTSVVAKFSPPRTPTLLSASPAPGGAGTFITLSNYENSFQSAADPQVDGHALQVAGVMIANGAANTGVSTGARLYSGAFISGADRVAQTTQAVVRAVFDPQNASLSDVRTVNHSYGAPLPQLANDGSNQRSLALDYFASQYDSLQVVAGDEDSQAPPRPFTPSDAYNIVNVSMLTDASGNGTGLYDRYDAGNSFAPVPGARDTVHIAAPGRSVFMPQLGGTGYANNSGTSFAAPHVTATTALLHQFGNAHRASDPQNWDESARRHQVMKAVLLNSADKLIDDGTIVPVGNLLGMQKTIFTDPAGTQTWLNSPAYNNPPDPLDDRIGAGALNASRALTQFSAGEHDSDLTSNGIIPVIGWDNAFSQGPGGLHTYYFDTPLMGNSFISATLSWDRIVNLNDTDNNGLFTSGESFAAAANPLADLDLFLFKKNSVSGLFTDLIFSSISGVDSTEHIFHRLTMTGDYALSVQHVGGSALSTEFGLAWWAVPVPEPASFVMLLLASVAVVLHARWRRY